MLHSAEPNPLAYAVLEYNSPRMKSIPDLVDCLVDLNNGNTAQAAKQLGSSLPNLSRYRSGDSRPRKSIEDRLRFLVEGSDDLPERAPPRSGEDRLLQLEDAISETLNSLREEFHRHSTVSNRQDVLDLVSTLMFAHVTSIDAGGPGVGTHLTDDKPTAVAALNAFVESALENHLPKINGHGPDRRRFFTPFSPIDERFTKSLLLIFDKDASAFRRLHESGRDDLINEVFSRFMSSSFVDEKEMGQYLTPPEVTRFMVEVSYHALTPDSQRQLLDAESCPSWGIVLDPSCGVGSFLAESIRILHEKVRTYKPRSSAIWLDKFLTNNIVGIDKSERMLRLACANLGLFGTSSANLFLANSLARRGTDAEITTNLQGRAQLILTNPPFGATHSGEDIAAYSIGKNRTKVDSEILFLERYVDWAAPGGIIATIVPDSILVNRGAFASLRSWLIQYCDIEAVFSLPSVTFAAAGTSTKTSVLLLRKKGTSASAHRGTFFGEAREVGYDVVTRSGQRRRVRHARSDLPQLLAEFKDERSLQLGRRANLPKTVERWDAGFHKEAKSVDEGSLLVSDVAELVDNRRDPRHSRTGEFNYIEISDVDGRTGLIGYKRLPVMEAPSRARKIVRTGDVLVSTVRPERGAIAVVPSHLDGAICSTGFAVLRCRDVHPGALAWLLKSKVVKKQMIRHNIGIAYPAIAEETCLHLALPASPEKMKNLSDGAAALELAQEGFEEARHHMMSLIGESTAAS